MRTYTYLVDNGRRYINWPGNVAYSETRIRAVAVALFIQHFGIHPNMSYGIDGGEARAWLSSDLRSPSVSVEQVNYDHIMRYPEQWMMHEGVPHPYFGPERQLKEVA